MGGLFIRGHQGNKQISVPRVCDSNQIMAGVTQKEGTEEIECLISFFCCQNTERASSFMVDAGLTQEDI